MEAGSGVVVWSNRERRKDRSSRRGRRNLIPFTTPVMRELLQTILFCFSSAFSESSAQFLRSQLDNKTKAISFAFHLISLVGRKRLVSRLDSFVADFPDSPAFVVTDIKRPVGGHRKADRAMLRGGRTLHLAGKAVGEELEGHRRDAVLEWNEDDGVSVLGQGVSVG